MNERTYTITLTDDEITCIISATMCYADTVEGHGLAELNELVAQHRGIAAKLRAARAPIPSPPPAVADYADDEMPEWLINLIERPFDFGKEGATR